MLSGVRKVTAALFLTGAAFGLGRLAGPSSAAPAPAAKPALVSLAAQQVGVRRCLPAIAAVAQRGTSGATMQDIIIDWNRQNADSAPFFSLTGMGAGTQRAALSIVAVPTPEGKCAVFVERISSGTGTCESVAANELPKMPGGNLINGIMVFQNPQTPDETYTLMQNPGSCVVIRRQAIFDWPPKK